MPKRDDQLLLNDIIENAATIFEFTLNRMLTVLKTHHPAACQCVLHHSRIRPCGAN